MRWRYGARPLLAAVTLLAGAAGVAPVSAQDLEPRAYAPNPTSVNFVAIGYGHSSGDVVFDAALPFSDVSAKINSASLGYARTFGLFGRSASAGFGLPYVWGTVQGNVAEQHREIYRSGLGDARLRLAMNLVGGPALTPREFAAHRPGSTLGASFIVAGPSGQYDGAKLINIGANRWAFKPELGFSHPAGRLALEAYAGMWFFTENADYFGGSRRDQSPIGTVQGHASYTFRPRLWLAGDATFYAGGQSTIDGVPRKDTQSNSRLGLTLALPLGRRQSVKLAWSSGFTTRTGADFKTLAVAWQAFWFGRP
ncbi:MAG: transporter [Vicinamibacteria bacterium]